MAATPNRGRTLVATLFCVLVCAATLLAYSEKPLHPFQFDDEVFILGEPSIRSLSNVPRMFAVDAHLLYRPLRQTLYALTVHWAGFEPAAFHWVGLALHLLACLALAPIGNSLLGSRRAGLYAAALAALHPVRSDRVANITGSFDLLAPVLALWGLAFWLAALRDPERSNRLRAVALPLLGCGLLAGEEALAVVLVAALAWWWLAPRSDQGRDTLRRLEDVLPLALLLAAYLALRTVVLGQVGRAPLPAQGPAPIWSFGVYFWRYVRLILVPSGLSVAYPERALALNEPWVMIGWSAMLAAALAWILWLRQRAVAVVLMLWGLLAIAPFCQLLPSGTPFAERYVYNALAPAALAAGWVLARLTRHGGARRVLGLLLFFTLLLVYGLGTFERVKVWRGPQTLWSDAVSKQPGAYLARLNHGNQLRDSGDLDAARAQFAVAVALDPNDSRGRINLGNVQYRLGELQAAQAQFLVALDADYDSVGARVGLASTFVSARRYNEALEMIAPVLRDDPDNLAALLVLGYISSIKGEYGQAIEVYQRALELCKDPVQVRVIGRNISTLRSKQGVAP
ncbi:MAG: tetratricopeptide repeat protein [Candidatus Alcyoniella australis]|nr:tetratricopeptide repeat protein [Candidatus Alcyoniella australis]